MNELMGNYAKTIDSREVAEMIPRPHADLMKTIRQQCEYLAAGDFSLGEYFQESSYVDGNGQTRPCYLVSRKGCEMIAHKTLGEKGVQFTAAYINRFHEMEQKQSPDTSQLPLGMQALRHIVDELTSFHLEQAEMKKQLAATAKSAEAAQATIINIKDAILVRDDDWRDWINTTFNKVVMSSSTKDYQTLRSETYEILEERANCNLNTRLRNLKERLQETGATKTKVNQATKLDCIEADGRIKEIYTSIIKEFSIRYVS